MKKIFSLWIILWPLVALSGTMQTAADEMAKHYTALPNLYEFETITKEQWSDKVVRQYLMGSQSMLVKWTLKKDAIIPMQLHASEQITWITQGSVKVLSQGKVYIVKAGGVLVIPPYVPHEFHALEDTIDIDFFTPVREDWLNKAPTYIKNINRTMNKVNTRV